MQFLIKSTKWNKVESDVIVFPVSEDSWQKEIAPVDTHFDKSLILWATDDNFKAGIGRLYAFPTQGKLLSKTVLLVGTGKSADCDFNTIRIVAAHLAKYAQNSHKTTLAIDLTFFSKHPISLVAKSLTEGFKFGGYSFFKYKSSTRVKKHQLKTVILLANSDTVNDVVEGAAEGELFADATIIARDLVNEPAAVVTPTYLGNQAKQLLQSGIKVEIFDKKEIEKMGMEAFLSVAKGSVEPPKFIKLTYTGGRKKVVVVGKGITFDTGGHSIKDSKNMETMKLDMAGGAAVLGIFSVLAKLKPKVTVVGFIAACENMVGPLATKPGDIVKAVNGKTIEILNTDAEGRLTLADVLSYAVKEKPEAIVDLATLTGACVVALGDDIAGLFTNTESLGQQLLIAGKFEGEKMWPLPLEKDYRDLNKSDIADLRNIGRSRYAGAITAALFLEEFVDRVPWAHIDLAGPSFAEKNTPLIPRGGSGFGVRTILEWLKNY